MKRPKIDFSPVNLDQLRILDDIKDIYYKNTGMIISFHYTGDGNRFDFYPQNERSDFCRLIHSTEKGLEKCLESDKRALEHAKIRGEYHIYRCHAGLVDIVIPLQYRGREIGAIYSGQVLTETQTDDSFDELYKRIKYLNVDYDSLKAAYFKVKVIDRERLIFCVKLLSLIANYIISVENELVLQKELMKKNREIARQENEKIKLEKSLKDLSISVLEFERRQKKNYSKLMDENYKSHYIISKAQLFIKTNYNNDLKLSDVAKAVYTSPGYFSALFKKITGYTFINYLTKVRMDEAKKLLIQTNIPIKEIVYRVGFKDYNYFNRTFKRLLKTPPARYRRTHRSESYFQAV